MLNTRLRKLKMNKDKRRGFEISVGPPDFGQDVRNVEPDSGIGSMVVERYFLARLLASLNARKLALVLWDGQTVSLPDAVPAHRVLIRDRIALWLLLAYPDYYLPGKALGLARTTGPTPQSRVLTR